MQPTEMKQRISRIKTFADMAVEACRRDDNCPQPLRARIVAFDRETNDVLRVAEHGADDAHLRQYIDELEHSGDGVKQACERAARLSDETRDAVKLAHDEVSRLKHQLH